MGEPKICRRCHQPVRPSEPAARFINGDVEHHHCFLGYQHQTVSVPPASPSPEPDAPHSYGTGDILKAIELTLEGLDDLGKTVRITGIEASAAGKLGAARAHLETAQRYLQAHPSQASAHDLRAANAELREKHALDLRHWSAQLDEWSRQVAELRAERDEAVSRAKSIEENGLSNCCREDGIEMCSPFESLLIEAAELRARAEKAEADWRSAVALINVLKGGENTAIRERDEARQLAAGAAEKGWRTFWAAFGDHLHLQSEQRVYGWHDLMNACEKGMDAVKADLANGAP